jgi:hypothetical protein
MALLSCVALQVPGELPAVAFRQVGLYRLEVALLVFYGSLLLITPAFSGLVRGRLPIEISTRGAKFADETGQTAQENEATIKELEQGFDDLADGLTRVETEIYRLKRKGDNR